MCNVKSSDIETATNKTHGQALALFALIYNKRVVNVHGIALRIKIQKLTFHQLQCEMVQRAVGWMFSLSHSNVVECLSQ